MGSRNEGHASLRYIPLSYNQADSQASALRLVLTLNPHWEHSEGDIEFIRFTDGITNTLLKIIKRVPGLSDEQVDNDAVLMRAYGNHTEILIDRERETRSHALLAERGLAPPLLARFQNGLLYRFIRGKVTSPDDLNNPRIFKAIARRLAQWHAVLPINEISPTSSPQERQETTSPARPTLTPTASTEVDDITPVKIRHAGTSFWSVLQKWILALPVSTEQERLRRRKLQKEFERIVAEFDDDKGLGKGGLVFAHCDLLSANVIVLPRGVDSTPANATEDETVNFIDYEYATPSPAAFDIANHFAEWAGYDCDFNKIPTQSVRKEFLTEYVKSYAEHSTLSGANQKDVVEKLFKDVDRFRGIPGFYWGVWALIQATISQIDFDYASYAELRLGEYWAWRREIDGTRSQAGEEMPLRERRWAQEA
ncbi:ethanolamine kinase [Histoplasma capsulatum G186AR]|uniref:ethanolamine kinase n=1 Tax=Ajellomyces capsulatus TaxID=5037 RepID=A0A8H7YY33_AJECA|nr:ethanolamine kinase [Histoplasma capsulatum]QSS68048.1 ethanolamine kinase [Histoplasma capsulatum G186AR]